MSRSHHQWGKTQEFYAHDSPINCVSIGRQSCSVFVSGGDDKVVKVWKIGRPTAIMSLDGHTSEVDSVMFDVKETQVAAGSRGGGIKLWDLDKQQLIRSLPGHRSSVRCLDFHPYGAFFAAGSDDCNIKIFDVRQKGCMMTYKGPDAVSCIKHSPDGRWLVSGDKNGVVRVWNLSSGKIVTELPAQSRSPVVSMDFHPHEFLLAVGGEQSTTIWDMETFTLVGTTPKESSTVRRVAFSKCGRSILSASSDALKTWAWDPSMAALDVMEVGWGAGPLGGAGASSTASQVLADMTEGAVPGKELIGIARNKTILQVYICNISTMVPFNQPIEGEELTGAAPYEALLDTMPRVSIEESAPAPTFAAAPSASSHHSSSSAAASSASILSSPNKGFFDAHAARDPNGVQVAVPAGPNPYAKLEAQKLAAQQLQQQQQLKADREAAIAAAAAAQQQQQQQQYTPAPMPSPTRPFQPSHPAQPFVPSQPAASSSSAAAAAAVPYYAGASSSSHKASLAAERAQFQAAAAASASAAATPPAQGAPSFASQLPPPPTAKADRPVTAAAPAPTVAAAQPAAAASVAASASSASSAASPASPKGVDFTAEHQRLEREHVVMMRILRGRQENLAKLAGLWGARGGALGGAKSCVSFVVSVNDLALTVDFLTFAEDVLSKGGVLTLDIARDLLPLVRQLLVVNKYEHYKTIALRYVRMMLVHFTGVIQSCRSAAALSGVDPTRDERLSRANDCYAQFKSIYDQTIAPLAKRTDAVGELAKDTRTHLEKLLWTKP